MKVKFLVPEIDKDKWSKTFSNKMKFFKLQLKSADNIGIESNYPQLLEKIINEKSIPSFDRFLTFCRFFDTKPDKFLSPIPKWIECDIEDISRFSVLGKMNDTYYIAPFETSSLFRRHYFSKNNISYGFKELEQEPNPLFFSDFHRQSTSCYTESQRLPSLDASATAIKVFQLLEEYGISRKNYQTLLDIKSNNVTNIKNGRNGWTKSHIYKLSWILDKSFEDLLVIKYHIPKEDSHKKNVYGYVHEQEPSDILTYLEYLQEDLIID